MLDFILQISIVLSLCLIIYLVAKALPRVEERETPKASKKSYFESLFKKLPLQKIDAVLSSFLEKILRKFRVVILKFENSINSAIKRLKKDNGESPNGSNGHSSQLFEDNK